MAFPEADVRVVRDLARRVAEVAALPLQQEKAARWRRFNALRPDRPMVLVFPEGSWRELLPDSTLQCTDPTCRAHEADLRRRLYHWDHLRDDNVIDGTVVSWVSVRNTGWGVGAHLTRPAEATGAAHYDPVIVEESDIDKIRLPQVSVDWAETERRYQATCELFDGLLPVEKRGQTHWGFAIVDQFSQWRGFGQLFLDMVDRPAWLHEVFSRLTDGMLGMLDGLEREGALYLNNGAHYCGSGGTGFSDELPATSFDGTHVRPRDLWGFATTQIFSDVSPAMHEEFALTYERRWLERFGLNAYGCCEPLHLKLDIVKTIPRLRRISMSPWVDMVRGAAELGNRYIFSRKPNPAVMATPSWEPDAVRRLTRDDLEKTRGCVVELVMKDTHTCLGQPQRMSDWVRIALEEAERAAR